MIKKVLVGLGCILGIFLIALGAFFVSNFFVGYPMVDYIFVSDISVSDSMIKMSGGVATSADAFRKYDYEIKDNNVYIKLIYVLCSNLYRSNSFNFNIKDNFSNTDNVYLTDGNKSELIWTRGTPIVYTYKGNLSADGVEIDEVIYIDKENTTLSNLELVRDRVVEKYFNGIKIDISDINYDVLTINLVDGSKSVEEYLNVGAAGSKINLDILKYSFLQPESNVKNWVSGLKILVNGRENAEGDHFNLSGIFRREVKSKTLATITDYGYEMEPKGYTEKYVVTENAQQFLIRPIDETTEIIVSELSYTDYGFFEGRELYRTNNPLLFVMELPEGFPYIMVKLKSGDRTSSWIPSFNGKDGTLIAPEEFNVIQNDEI